MRKDNRGLTLIELMVAVTMLAVVISPFLNTFVVAAKQNNKAREALRATTVAQNLMESLGAFSLEEVLAQVDGDVSDSKLYMSGSYDAHKDVSSETNKYEVHIQGIEEDGKKYDARILMDASEYEDVSTGNYMEVSMMNEATDAILSVSQTDDTTAMNGWNWNNTVRTFNVEVKDNGSKVDITIKTEYRLNGTGTIRTGKTLSKTLDTLDNVYIMFYPNYSRKIDNFLVTYNTDKKINLYLVKQRHSSTQVDSNYVASIKVTDSNTDDEARITLRTNILEDFYVNNAGISMDYNYNSKTNVSEVGPLLGFWKNEPQSLVGQTHKSNSIYKATVQIYPEGTYPDKFSTEQPLAQLGN